MSSIPKGAVCLIACCSAKAPHAAPVRHFYTSDLFRKSLAFADRNGFKWAVLSAKHGLILPDQVIEPYDLSIAQLTAMNGKAHYHQWGAQIADALGHFETRDFVFLAGQRYRDAITSSQIWRARLYQAHIPMEGLGIGQQKAWLANAIAA